MKIQKLTNREEGARILKFFYGPLVWYWKLTDLEKKGIAKRVENALKGDAARYWYFSLADGTVVAAGGTDEIKDTDHGFFISWFGVHKKWRRKGLGGKIIAAAEKYALSKKARSMTIDTGEGNKEANIFYQAIGYKKVGFIPHYYGPGDGKVIYYKKLG